MDLFAAAGQTGDPLGRLLNASGYFLNLGAQDGFVEGAGHKAHHRYLLVDKDRHGNGGDFIACLGVNAVQVIMFVAQVILVFVGN